MLNDVLAGLKHLHNANFMHRDCKSENFLFSKSENTFKIADLGCARSYKAKMLTGYVGTRWYRAPE